MNDQTVNVSGKNLNIESGALVALVVFVFLIGALSGAKIYEWAGSPPEPEPRIVEFDLDDNSEGVKLLYKNEWYFSSVGPGGYLGKWCDDKGDVIERVTIFYGVDQVTLARVAEKVRGRDKAMQLIEAGRDH